jgi:hypothetical protein
VGLRIGEVDDEEAVLERLASYAIDTGASDGSIGLGSRKRIIAKVCAIDGWDNLEKAY